MNKMTVRGNQCKRKTKFRGKITLSYDNMCLEVQEGTLGLIYMLDGGIKYTVGGGS